MRTRSRSRSRNNSLQREASPAIVEPHRIELPFLEDQFQEDPPPESPMADNRTMAELLQAPTEGYEDAIVIPEITANNFELKHGLINLVQNKQFFGHDKEDPQNKQFFGHDKEDPHAHIRYFNKITSTMRVPNFFPHSKMTNLRNEITRFQQRFDESFYEAWERFNDLLRACPHHGFSELHQLDTFYNALDVNDQVSLNSAAGGNFLDKMPRECTSSSAPSISSDVAELKDMVKALLLDKKNQSPAPTPSTTPALVKAVEPNCVTCSGGHSYQNCPATSENAYRDNIQKTIKTISIEETILTKTEVEILTSLVLTKLAISIKANLIDLRNQCQNIQNQYQNLQLQMANLTDMMTKMINANTASSSGSGTLAGNTITNPKEELKGITTRSGVAYQGPKNLSPSEQGTNVTKDQVQTPSSQNTTPVQPSVIQSKSEASVSEPVVAPVSAPMPNLKPLIPYPSRRDNEKHPLVGNKEKLSEMARTTMNEHCSTVILNKLPRKLGDPEKFLIPCEFSGMDECLALADLGASINLMPLSVWEGLSLLELTPTCMTLELADRLVSKPIGIAKDVSFKVRVFYFPTDFVQTKLTLFVKYTLRKFSGFVDVTVSGSPTLDDDPIVSTTSPTLTPFGDSDFLLFEEADAFLEVELKDLPHHLEYAFLEGDTKLPVIIAKELGSEKKSALIK
nr:hypothetical protein [Tanacetum cinerariifolium]